VSLVGNDVVDLEDAANAGAHLRERFVARVCHASERALLARSARPKALLWSLFAAKEAAYKVLCKHLPAPPVLAHRRFLVAEDLRSISCAGVALCLRLAEDAAGWVHALAWLGEVPPAAWGVVPVGEGAPGQVARQALCAYLHLGEQGTAAEVGRELRAEAFGAAAQRAEVLVPESVGAASGSLVEVRRARRPGSWDGFGPPIALRGGRALPVDVSLSHDGRFAAFAVAPAHATS
jgi:phosphopantetheinyl transferase (holo-ACP synthase)